MRISLWSVLLFGVVMGGAEAAENLYTPDPTKKKHVSVYYCTVDRGVDAPTEYRGHTFDMQFSFNGENLKVRFPKSDGRGGTCGWEECIDFQKIPGLLKSSANASAILCVKQGSSTDSLETEVKRLLDKLLDGNSYPGLEDTFKGFSLVLCKEVTAYLERPLPPLPKRNPKKKRCVIS